MTAESSQTIEELEQAASIGLRLVFEVLLCGDLGLERRDRDVGGSGPLGFSTSVLIIRGGC